MKSWGKFIFQVKQGQSYKKGVPAMVFLVSRTGVPRWNRVGIYKRSPRNSLGFDWKHGLGWLSWMELERWEWGEGWMFYEFVSVFLDKPTYETNSLTNIFLYLTAVGSPLRKLKQSLLTLFRCYSMCTSVSVGNIVIGRYPIVGCLKDLLT